MVSVYHCNIKEKNIKKIRIITNSQGIIDTCLVGGLNDCSDVMIIQKPKGLFISWPLLDHGRALGSCLI